MENFYLGYTNWNCGRRHSQGRIASIAEVCLCRQRHVRLPQTYQRRGINEDLRRRLGNESERPLIGVITDPIPALHDSVSETMDIDYFDRSFIVSRLLRPGRSLRLWVKSFLPVRSFTVWRIRCGFWRLSFSDHFHPTSFGLTDFGIGSREF